MEHLHSHTNETTRVIVIALKTEELKKYRVQSKYVYLCMRMGERVVRIFILVVAQQTIIRIILAKLQDTFFPSYLSLQLLRLLSTLLE